MEIRIRIILFSFFVLILCSVGESGKILFFAPFVSKSIVITYSPILKELAKKGHQVTAVTASSTGLKDPNVHEIIPATDMEKKLHELSGGQLQEGSNPFGMLKMLEIVFDNIDHSFGHPDMQALFNDPTTKYDAAIVVPFFGNEAGYYLAHRFKAPLILYFTGQVSLSWVDDAMGQPHNTAYLPTPILPFTSEMNFFQRAINTFGNFVFHRILRNMYILSNDYRILNKYFPNEVIPDLIELEKNASLSMSFSHPLLMDGWRPYVPNHVNLGMMNCKAVKELEPTNKIRQFLDNAKEGVIFISFGTVVKASGMPPSKLLAFLNAFKKLKQKVLWKWETEQMDGQPDNVMLSKWLPQQEVLAHPNVKLFITHGGQSSFQETLCHKKPVVVIPVTGDQPANGAESERLGIGLSINFRHVTEENLYEALQKVLTDPSYTNTVKELGTTMMDQINHPLDRAVWWIEHIMRNPTLYSRRSPVHNLTWYQYLLLDVLAFYAAIVAFVSWIVYKLVVCCCYRKKNNLKIDEKDKKKKQH